MRPVDILNKFAKCKIFWLSYIALYVLLVLTTVVIVRTTCSVGSPFENITGDVWSVRKNEVTEIHYKRNFTITTSTVAYVSRVIVNLETNEIHELVGIVKELPKGTHSMYRITLVPAGLPDGRYELRTSVVWQPMFSLVYHVSHPPHVMFKICGKTIKCAN